MKIFKYNSFQKWCLYDYTISYKTNMFTRSQEPRHEIQHLAGAKTTDWQIIHIPIKFVLETLAIWAKFYVLFNKLLDLNGIKNKDILAQTYQIH